MEKVITLLWILFGLGAFVFRLIQKARETSAQEAQERPSRPGGAVPELPTATFQELLRQMQARNTGEQAPAAPVPAVPAAASPRTPGGRLLPREIARPTRSQERTTARQTSLEAPAVRQSQIMPSSSVRRSSDMPRASAQSRQDTARQTPPADAAAAVPLHATVRQLLRQPESVRAAFVLSEIFQRKY